MKWDPAPTDQELLEGNAADRRRAARNPLRRMSRWLNDLSERRDDWIMYQLNEHPEIGIYWLGAVSTIYLGFQARDIFTPAPGRWITVAIFVPMMLLVPAMAFAVGRLTRAMHLAERRRREQEEQAERDRAYAELKAKMDADKRARELKAQHDMLDCPGPKTSQKPRHDRQGELIQSSWVCPVCQQRWEHRGLWMAP